MKLSNKCRPIPKEYQISCSHQTVIQFESKLILIRRAKLHYIITLPFARRVFKIIVLKLKLQKRHENSICEQNDNKNTSRKNYIAQGKIIKYCLTRNINYSVSYSVYCDGTIPFRLFDMQNAVNCVK